MADDIKRYGLKIDADGRVGTAPWGGFGFSQGLTKEQCKTIIRRQIKTIESSDKLRTDFEREDRQPSML